MTEHQIKPELITRPFQLLASWLAGLVITNASFLTAATQITSPSWLPTALVIASLVNVPIFLISIFLLQTKFRAEMQEDPYYSKYLELQYTGSIISKELLDIDRLSKRLTSEIITEIGPEANVKKEPIEKILIQSQVEQLVRRHGGNRTLSELFLSSTTWNLIVDKWNTSEQFQRSIDDLIQDRLITIQGDEYKSIKLTSNGFKIAEKASERGALFAQDRKEYWERDHPEG